MLKRPSSLSRSRALFAAALCLAVVAAAGAACGSSSKASTNATATPGAASTAQAGRTPGGRGFGNRTPPPEIQTSIAQGTPFAGGGDPTRRAAIQTSIAEGTPATGFGFRTPSADEQTAIAQGTPFARPGGFDGAGRGRTLTTLAGILNVPEEQLRTELAAPGATIAKVSAAHGVIRTQLRQLFIAATKQALDEQVQSGTLTQDEADQALAQLQSSIDSIFDGNGAPPAPGGAGQ
jgi:hypothetical protein